MLSQDTVLVAANGEEMETYMSGSVCLGRFKVDDVHFCPEVGSNGIIVSGSVLDILGYHYGYGRGKCCVKDLRTAGSTSWTTWRSQETGLRSQSSQHLLALCGIHSVLPCVAWD